MTLILNLTPEQEAALQRKAAQMGIDVDTYLRRLVEMEAIPTPDSENEAVMRLLRQWQAEDEGMSPEEAEEAETEWQELQTSLNANRKANGERLLFP